MDITTYAIEHEVEQDHWWFVGRRSLFLTLINSLHLKKQAKILDIGSSSGTNLRMLKEAGYTNYSGMDIAPESQEFCANKKLGNVILHNIQDEKITENSYELILATDILEHLPHDDKAILHMFEGLVSGGHALITVPCFPALWGPQDIVSHHLRRYVKKDLQKKLQKAGFRIERSFYFNFLLFLPILLVRKLLMARNKIVNENSINSPLLNRIFKTVFQFDCWISKIVSPPFGVSALFLVKKP